jgi:low affinity Fe/Cu permease
MYKLFHLISANVSNILGSIWAFLAVLVVVLITGYFSGFSIQWEAKTGFIISFVHLLILIFLQKSQNHSNKAIQLKLDELIHSIEGARNHVAAVEKKDEEDIEKLRKAEDKNLFKKGDVFLKL